MTDSLVDVMIRHILPAAYALLPAPMGSSAASALLIAIGLQESRFRDRAQWGGGPARSFWMFEPGGAVGVLTHPRAGVLITRAAATLRYSHLAQFHSREVVQLIEHNDVLAACFARCLLWTLPAALPTRDEPAAGWGQYLAAWRPGKPHPETWDGFYTEAWTRVAEAEKPT